MNLCNGSLVSQLPRKYWLAHMNTTYIIMKNPPPNDIWRYDIEIMGFGTTCLTCQVLWPLLKPTYFTLNANKQLDVSTGKHAL